MPNQIDKLILKLPQNRQLLGSLLMDKNWFKNTDFSLQKQILELPEKAEGYVFDLAHRDDRLGGIEVKKMVKLSIGENLITSVFQVYSPKTKKTALKEYVTWCYGRNPGIKGLILIKTDNRITHFVTTKDDKFPVGSNTFDAVGGLTQYSPELITHLTTKIKNTILKKLGVETIDIVDVYDLGHIEVDNGLTSNQPGIFAITINCSTELTKSTSKNIEFVPIEQLDQYISKVDDSFFLAIVSRLLAKNIISL